MTKSTVDRGQDSVLGVILARGGSKGLPRKNVRDLAGKPLIAWTIEAALQSDAIDRLVLSSDDEEIMRVAEVHGCEAPFRRPEELARDDTPSIDALLHALDQLPSYDYVVLLQPTSPLRTAADIDAAVAQCREAGAPACVTVTEVDKPPEWMYRLTEARKMKPLLEREEPVTRRQDAPATYVLNGAVYVAKVDWLKRERSFKSTETVAHIMPKQRSADVDTDQDLAWCEMLMQDGS